MEDKDMNFVINVDNIKIASGEEDISKTIEELLAINDRIPARKNEELMEITEKQFDHGKEEKMGITEEQFEERNSDDRTIIENEILKAPAKDGGNRPEAWDQDDKKMRGHKSIQPIWIQVYKNEDKRKDDGRLKKRK